MLNYGWLLSGEAVDAVEAGDASLRHSSSILVAGWFQARFQMRLDDDDALSSSYGASFFWGACGVLLQEGGFPCCDLLEGWGRVRDPVEAAFQGRSGHSNNEQQRNRLISLMIKKGRFTFVLS